MSIRLTWRDVNAAIADNIIIYRDTVPIPPDSLPTPLVTLAGSATTYDDTTVVRGTVYYYRIAAVKGVDFVLSDNKIHGYFPDSGPGPQTLLRGDWKRGYFGRVTVPGFLTVAETRTVAGLTAGTAVSEATLTHWMKFIFDGKIIFVPCTTLTTGISWKSIYDAGLVYGVDGFGSPGPGMSTVTFNVNQKKQVTVKGFEFLIRLPKASPLPTTTQITTPDQHAEGEWLELLGRSYLASVRPEVKPHWEDLPALAWYSFTQHCNAANIVLVFVGETSSTSTATNAGAGYGWLPFFELVY